MPMLKKPTINALIADPEFAHLEKGGRDWILHLEHAMVKIGNKNSSLPTLDVELHSDATGVVTLLDGEKITFEGLKSMHWQKP